MIFRNALGRPDRRRPFDARDDVELPDVVSVRDEQALPCTRQAVIRRRHLGGEEPVGHGQVPHGLDGAPGRGATLEGDPGELLQAEQRSGWGYSEKQER